MPRTYPYVRVVQFGTIAVNQKWSTGFSVSKDDSTIITGAQLNTWLNSLDTALLAWWNATSSIRGFNANDTNYQGANAYFYRANDRIAFTQAVHTFSTAQAGASGTSSMPTQNSCVSSLLTGFPGRSFRGRRYLPMTAIALNNHQFTNLNVDQIAAAEVALFQAVNASLIGTSHMQVVLANNRDIPLPISTVRVDSEPDVQRRRADKLVASYFKSVTV